MIRAATVPLEEIERIQIYVNRKKYTERQMGTILKETGGDLMFNGTIFSWSAYKPLTHCKADGTVLCKPDYSVYGLAWDGPGSYREAVLPSGADSYIACVPLIIGGQKAAKPNYQPDMGGARPRTVMGVKEGRFAYYVTSENRTPEWCRDYLHSVGWSHATMLDGGGSTCFLDASGHSFACDKSRRVQNYIIVHLRHGEYDEVRGERPMVEINAYSKAKDGGKKLSTNFKVSEFACKDGSDAVLVAPRLVMVLQSIRSHFGKAVTVSSAYRTPQYNKKVGGVEGSQHTYGTAADISIKGIAPQTLAAFADTLMPDWGGIGIYDNDRQGHFVHIDVRDDRSRW